MRVAVTRGVGERLVLEDRPDPEPGPGELLLEVAACGICGSDLHLADIGIPGVVLGHEFAGEVLEVGADTSFRPGDRVCAFPLVGCGTCPACLDGTPAHCRVGGELIGLQRPGAFAERVLTAAKDTFRLPASLDWSAGALVEPLAVARHAVDGALREPADPVLVLGGGPVGQAVVLWLRHLRGGPVVLSDPVASRRSMAEEIGAMATVDPTSEDVRSAFERVVGAPPAAVIECVGVPGLIQHALDVAGPEARVTVVGVCMTPDTVVPVTALAKEVAMRFVLYYRKSDFELTLRALDVEGLDPAPLVTDHIGLEAVPERFEALKHPTTEGKVLIEP